MLISAIDATGFTVIIGAIFLGATQILTMVLSYMRERERLDREAEMARKVDAVKMATIEEAQTLAKRVDAVKQNVTAVSEQHDKKIDGIVTKVEEIRKQTDGMKTELVEAVRAASFAAGIKAEKEKNGN